jgi:hypothetical protein
VLPTDAQARKDVPVATGFVDYFPDAIAAVAELSRIGNDQHNPGKPLFWDRSKSGDESDALMRHFLQRGTLDTDGVRHSTKVAWRALALLQKEIEADYDGQTQAVPVSATNAIDPADEPVVHYHAKGHTHRLGAFTLEGHLAAHEKGPNLVKIKKHKNTAWTKIVDEQLVVVHGHHSSAWSPPVEWHSHKLLDHGVDAAKTAYLI